MPGTLRKLDNLMNESKQEFRVALKFRSASELSRRPTRMSEAETITEIAHIL